MDLKFYQHCVTGLCAVLMTIFGYIIADYDKYIKKDELASLAPYGKAKQRITRHMHDAESALVKINESLDHLNTQMIAQRHEADIRLTLLEDHTNAKR